VTRLRAGRPGFVSRQGRGSFSLRHRVQTGSGDYPASHPTPTGGECLSPGVKGPGRESDHSQLVLRLRALEAVPPLPRSSSWHGTYLSAGNFSMAWYLDKLRENFTVTLLCHLLSHFHFSWYFSSWTSGAPHHWFKYEAIALPSLYVMSLVQLFMYRIYWMLSWFFSSCCCCCCCCCCYYYYYY